MSFPRYPSYKDSGVEWLGEVPEHWVVYKLQDLAKNEKYSFVDGPFGSDLKNEEYTDNGIPLIQLNNINEGAHVLNSVKYVSAAKADQLARHNAFPGDIAIAKMADPVARAAIVNDSFSRYVIVADCIRLSVADIFAAPRFVVYAINSPYFRSHAIGMSAGITRLRINLGALKQIRIGLPPLPEQTQIAVFLDRETAKIDALVAEQQRLLELLKEKRQAVISHAVTKGLNPNAPMKPSGIDWLGNVPAHWEVRRVKSVSTFTTSGPRGWSERVGDEGSLFVQSGDLNQTLGVDFASSKRVSVAADAEAARTLLNDGDVVVCITGAKTGNVAVCTSVPEAAYINQHLCLIRPNSDVLPVFLAVLLKCDLGQTYFDFSQYGLKQGLSLEDVREAPVLIPPLTEQTSIVSYVDSESAKFDTLTAEAQRAIDLLQERRTALISAAVTGQIDVRAAGLGA